MRTLTITQPDDWHLHLRDEAMLDFVTAFSARQFARALIMPNLSPPILTVQQALGYRHRILSALPKDSRFEPYMSLYLSENTPYQEIEKAAKTPFILGFKLYPAGATTHSEAGVGDLENVYPLLEYMESQDLVLQVHGEVTDNQIDIFDREKIFIERELQPIHQRFPNLRIVLEHITTAEGVDFVTQTPANIAGTLTPQHLLYNRNALLAGGIRPHNYCLPVLKRETHRQALIQAATSGSPKFFLGTDSAPHVRERKESACGCAGCFTAPLALELYAEVFDQANSLDKLENFASRHGADFYRLPYNPATITLELLEWEVPETYASPTGIEIAPLRGGETIPWRVVGN